MANIQVSSDAQTDFPPFLQFDFIINNFFHSHFSSFIELGVELSENIFKIFRFLEKKFNRSHAPKTLRILPKANILTNAFLPLGPAHSLRIQAHSKCCSKSLQGFGKNHRTLNCSLFEYCSHIVCRYIERFLLFIFQFIRFKCHLTAERPKPNDMRL